MDITRDEREIIVRAIISMLSNDITLTNAERNLAFNLLVKIQKER